MLSSIAETILVGEGTFTIFVAPPALITSTLLEFLKRQKDLTLYISGNYPIFLPNLSYYADNFSVRRALTAFQVLSILDEAFQTVVLFEHDNSLYDEKDLLPIIGRRCQEHDEGRTILLFSSKLSSSISELMEYADRVIVFRDNPKKAPSKFRQRTGRQLTLNLGEA